VEPFSGEQEVKPLALVAYIVVNFHVARPVN